MKTTIESMATMDHVQIGPDGEILDQYHDESKTVKTIHTAEPNYIKLYVQDILYMSDVPKQYAALTYALLKYCSYADSKLGQVVGLTSLIRDMILQELGWEKRQTLNNALAALVKGNIIKRLAKDTYQLNPYLFGKGNWVDVDRIRVTWDYDAIKGRTFNTVIHYKQEENGQMVFEMENVNNEEAKASTDSGNTPGKVSELLPDTGNSDRRSA